MFQIKDLLLQSLQARSKAYLESQLPVVVSKTKKNGQLSVVKAKPKYVPPGKVIDMATVHEAYQFLYSNFVVSDIGVENGLTMGIDELKRRTRIKEKRVKKKKCKMMQHYYFMSR